MRQDAQKSARKFCKSKEGKNSETHPEKPKKGETGCVLGAGGSASGWERMKTGGKAQCLNHIAIQHMKKENRQKPRVSAGFVAGAEGLGFGCRLGRAWTQPAGLQAPTTRTAGGPAGAPRCQILPHTNEKSQVPQKRYLTFLAGAEGLEPSARGFGVDVGERTREREKADVIRFPPQAPERPVLVWCCELFLEKDCVSTTTSSFERKAPPPGGWPS